MRVLHVNAHSMAPKLKNSGREARRAFQAFVLQLSPIRFFKEGEDGSEPSKACNRSSYYGVQTGEW